MRPETEDTGIVPVIGDKATVRGAVLKPTLVCVSGNDMGRSFRLDSTKTIGRSPVEIELADRDVSRRHAVIRSDHGYDIEDLGSLNGTFVNGQRITTRTQVKVGDRIQVGRTVFLFTIQDELEQRMMSIVRLEAMATMAGGIAHDFNNALAVVTGNLDYLAEVIPKGDAEALQCVEDMRNASNAAVSLARQLLQLGRADTDPFTEVAIGDIVTKTAAMARRRGKAKIVVSTRIPPELTVVGSADDLVHVLLNLSYNACDAMPNGGRLDIDARAVHLDPGEALRCQLDRGGDYVELRVSDTGHGMDRATLERVFDPFFTTKPRGQGTGLGLAMVHATVRRHGGTVEVDSIPGRGTVFTLLLPRPPSASRHLAAFDDASF